MKKIIIFLITTICYTSIQSQPIRFNRMYNYTTNGSGNRFHQVIQNNNKYIAFGQYDTVSGYIQPICAKFDSLGNLMFWKSYRDTLKSYGLSMWNADVKTNDGGFIISGSIWEQPDLYKGFLLKLDSNLNMQWRRYYYDNNPNSSWVYSDYSFLSLKETPDNGFLATGIRYRNSGIATALVLKTDSLGNEEWVKTHLDNKFFSSYATSINLPSGEYVLGG